VIDWTEAGRGDGPIAVIEDAGLSQSAAFRRGPIPPILALEGGRRVKFSWKACRTDSIVAAFPKTLSPGCGVGWVGLKECRPLPVILATVLMKQAADLHSATLNQDRKYRSVR